MHTPHDQPHSNEPDVLQPEDGDMDENQEEEENEEDRSIGGDEESDMTEEREPQLETLGVPKIDGRLGVCFSLYHVQFTLLTFSNSAEEN